jgi:PAS domain S-box-containing protein
MTESEILKLLVVEDDETDQIAIRRCIRQCGIPATADLASTAADALRMAGEQQYDCILLDYYIPGVEGPALLNDMRRTVPGIPVVMFTGRGDEDVAVELMKSGAIDYIPKASLTPDRLASGLRHARELARSAAERRVAEEELRREQARFRVLANSNPQLAWISDADGSRTWFNERWFEFTGTTLDEVSGFGWKTVHDPAEIERVWEDLEAALASREPWEEVNRLRGADGQYRWFISRAVPVIDEYNHVDAWIGTNTDITELMEARLDAEAAARSRDEIIATVSHDLRSPLTVIVGFAQRLQRVLSSGQPIDKQELSEGAREIEASAASMNSLISNLMDATMSESGEMSLVYEPCDLTRLVRAVVQTHQRINPTREIRIEAPATSVIGVWDIGRIERVLTNIISNALKYSPAGGAVTVETRLEGEDAIVCVSDQGFGIPEAEIPKLFERFTRGSNVAGRIPGVGLGLASAEEIVSRHGGSISVESLVGSGSKFTVRLPLYPADEPLVPDDADSA